MIFLFSVGVYREYLHEEQSKVLKQPLLNKVADDVATQVGHAS